MTIRQPGHVRDYKYNISVKNKLEELLSGKPRMRREESSLMDLKKIGITGQGCRQK
jgi:hypothetical protein